ncbi:hypothetical protein LOD99_4063 [Oopsacas minuta]|uniref:Integrase catalytic domain-containing protein n=1 Tax=Oopsacas minuta TaxID=111878 RepID=A0AAV7JVQ5_9METZ|nr:hypothetical protein LOD99_4063 [Oopsacas minuta]
MEQSFREEMLKRNSSDTKSLLMTKHEYFLLLEEVKVASDTAKKSNSNTMSLGGDPQILQSDNCSEFTASVITALKVIWPDLLMVHGKPRHPESQGSGERLNCDFKDLPIAWLGYQTTVSPNLPIQEDKSPDPSEATSSTPLSATSSQVTAIQIRHDNTQLNRKRVTEGQLAQTERMLKRSRLEQVARDPGELFQSL